MKKTLWIAVSMFVTCGWSAVGADAGEIERGWTLVREDLVLHIDPAAGALRLEGTLVARLDHDDNSPGPVLAMA